MYIQAHAHTQIRSCIHTYIHTYIHTMSFYVIHTYIHTYKHTYRHKYIHSQYTYTYIPYIHIYTYTHIYITHETDQQCLSMDAMFRASHRVTFHGLYSPSFVSCRLANSGGKSGVCRIHSGVHLKFCSL